MSEEKEIWKNINGYEELYKISNTGNVLSVKRDIILKPGISQGYYRVCLSKKNKHKTIEIHRLVAEHFLDDWDEKLEVDHRDGDRKNNKLSNLRMATRSQNRMNRKTQKNNTSGFKGVSYISSNKKYQAQIKKDRKSIFKYFDTAIDAARFYNEQAIILHNEFARLNIIDE